MILLYNEEGKGTATPLSHEKNIDNFSNCPPPPPPSKKSCASLDNDLPFSKFPEVHDKAYFPTQNFQKLSLKLSNSGHVQEIV